MFELNRLTIAQRMLGGRVRRAVRRQTDLEAQPALTRRPSECLGDQPSQPKIQRKPHRVDNPEHRLVILGDSLSHGFHNMAVGDTRLSYASLVARALGCQADFHRESFEKFGGHPLNLEYVARAGKGSILGQYPASTLAALYESVQALDYWRQRAVTELKEKGPAPIRLPRNIAVYGWDLRDLLSRTADREAMFLQDCLTAIKGGGPFWFTRYAEMCKRFAGLLVLDGARDSNGNALTPLQAARAVGDDGGVETLIVFIGANNLLGVLGDMQIRYSQDPGYRDLYLKERYNVWCPEHFCSEYQLILDELVSIKAQHVILGTVPHIIATPSANPVGQPISIGGKTYSTLYTHPWISRAEFDQKHDDYLTADQAHQLNTIADAYNDFIVKAVEVGQQRGFSWHLFDACALLDSVAAGTYPLPEAIKAADPPIDARYFQTDSSGKRTQGGLFSLDGAHPTTVGYAIFAKAMLDVMTGANVQLSPEPSDEAFNSATKSIDFGFILKNDTLVNVPPKSITATHNLIEGLMDSWQMVQLFRGVL